MWLRAILAVAIFALPISASRAWAQGALPSTIRSSPLTQAQHRELESRLRTSQAMIGGLASRTDLQAQSIERLAIEIFEADPGLTTDRHFELVRSGAFQLSRFLTEARRAAGSDPETARLRDLALNLAAAGRLRDAQTAYAQVLERRRVQIARAEDAAADAAARDLGAIAELSLVASQFSEAADQFWQAANVAHDVGLRRALILSSGFALQEQSRWSHDPRPLREAIQRYEGEQERDPQPWPAGKGAMGSALTWLASWEPAALLRGIELLRDSLTEIDAAASPALWALTAARLGSALADLGSKGNDAALFEAKERYEAALAVLSERDENYDEIRGNYALVLLDLADLGDASRITDAIAIFQARLEMLPQGLDRAVVHVNLGSAWEKHGDSGGGRASFRAAEAQYRAAGELITADISPRYAEALPRLIRNVQTKIREARR